MTPFNFKISAEEILKFLNKSPIAQVEKIWQRPRSLEFYLGK
jgi:hypothetical protein